MPSAVVVPPAKTNAPVALKRARSVLTVAKVIAPAVAEKHVALRDERGERPDARERGQGDEVGLGVTADVGDEVLFAGAGGQKDLRAQLVLQSVAHGGETFGRPQAIRAAGSRMDENLGY